MKQHKKRIDLNSVYGATAKAKDRTDNVIENARQLTEDPDKAKRKEENQCPACFYVFGRMGGASITHRPCGICEKDMMFGSTCTDSICDECASENGLCKHCGGDIDMKHRRKERPFEKQLNKG